MTRPAIITFLLAAIAVFALSSAQHASTREMRGVWYLDVPADSASFFSAKTLRFSSSRVTGLSGGCLSGGYLKHRPCFIAGKRGELGRKEFFLEVERDTAKGTKLEFYGSFTKLGGEIVFRFVKPGEGPIDEREHWFSRKYNISVLENGKKLMLERLAPLPPAH